MANTTPPTALRTRKDLAVALGISGAMVTKLAKRGMPVDDLDKAVRWRQRHLEWQRSKGVRADTVAPDAGPASQRAAVSTAAVDGVLPAGVAAAPQAKIVAHQVAADGAELPEEYNQARTRREIAEANLAEMKESEQRGVTIRLDVIEATLAIALATAREALLQIPARMAPLLAAEADPASVQTLLHSEIHQVLTQLSGAARLGQPERELT